MINWVTLAPFLGFIIYLFIIAFQFNVWIKTKLGRLFALYLFCAGLYSFSSWLMHKGSTPSPIFWLKVELSAVFLMLALMMHFALEFPMKRAILGRSTLFWYIPPVVLEFLLVQGKLIKDFEFLGNKGGQVIIEFYPIINLLWIYTTIITITASIIYLHYFKKGIDINRKLVIYPFLGVIVSFIGGILNIVPSLRAVPVDQIGQFLYALLVSYAIVRYQFLNPGAIFKKSSIYTLVTFSFGAVFIFLLYKILPIVEKIQGWQLWLIFSPVALFIVFLTTPLRQKSQNWLDRIFFGELYNYRLTIEDFSKKAASNLDFKELTGSLVTTLNRVFKCPVALFTSEKDSLHLVDVAGYVTKTPEYSFLSKNSPVVEGMLAIEKPFHVSRIRMSSGHAEVMESELKWLDNIEAELICPLIAKDSLSGIIVLGKKKGLYPYSDEDMSLLSTIGPQIAIALDNARLYSESQEAYRELKEAQEHLMHSERMRLLGEVSSGVAHDLNNHLAVISARSEMNLTLINNPQAYKNTELILKAAEDSAKVVQRLREFVKKPKDIQQDVLDVNKLITELLPMIEHRRSELEQARGVFYEIEPRLRTKHEIMGNSSEIRQAMVNIIFNAFDAMPNGGKIEVESQDKDEWVVVSLGDNGVGMTTEVKEKIFKPFFSTKGEKGSGLGLNIAQGIVNKHGGKLTFDSEVGKGTTFYLAFPAAAVTTANGKMDTKKAVISGDSRKVLVIEDNKELGESIAVFLNEAGYNAMLATDGTEGLAQFQKDNFNMVVTDWGLSPMTGGDVAISIKAMKPQSKIPILVITGWELNISPTTLRDMGIVDVVIKPFSREEFLARISRVAASI